MSWKNSDNLSLGKTLTICAQVLFEVSGGIDESRWRYDGLYSNRTSPGLGVFNLLVFVNKGTTGRM